MDARCAHGICLPHLLRPEKTVEEMWLDCGYPAYAALSGVEA